MHGERNELSATNGRQEQSCEELFAQALYYEGDGKYSVLPPFPARYLTDLGTEPYQEFLTLILKPRIAFLSSYS